MKISFSFKQEIWRKLLHLTSIWIPIGYMYFDKKNILIILALLTILTFVTECLKKYFKFLLDIYNKFFSKILREHEEIKFTGASYLFLSSLITIFLFSKIIAITAISILIIADSFAALIGKKYGMIKIGEKTLEGTIAFVISGILVIIIIGNIYDLRINYYISSIVSVIITSFIELFSKLFCLDDNLLIPLTFASTITILKFLTNSQNANF